MRNTLCLFGLLLVLSCKGQYYKYQAEISPVNTHTLYRLNMDPATRMAMSSDFNDTRIFDSRRQEVPYMVLNEAPLKSTSSFVAYPVVRQKDFELYSELVIENTAKEKISNIAFNINNSDAYKQCAIEGSNDLEKWYSVTEKQWLSLAYSDHYTNTYQCVYFPLSDYKYFRLLIDNIKAQPFRINAAGYFKNSVSPGRLVPLQAKTRIENDARNKTTLIFVTLNTEQEIDRLDFYIKAPRLFKRQASVYKMEDRKQKHHTEQVRNTLYTFELKTDRPLLFDLPFRAKEFVIEVQNEDNPPLSIDSVSFKQLAAYLVCDLAPNEKYTITWGNEKLASPRYDLADFVSTVPHLLPDAQLGVVNLLPVPTGEQEETKRSFLESRVFLWSCIIAGALILLYFSFSLIREMKGKNVDG